MKFFAKASRAAEVPNLLEQSKAYKEYLQSVRERLPLSAFEFAAATWHYDYSDHRCPHDSWVESLTIDEPARGGRLEDRSLHISTRLSGAFHDGHLVLAYADVQMYSIENPKAQAGHGDWLIDETRLHLISMCLLQIQDFVFSSATYARIARLMLSETGTPTAS